MIPKIKREISFSKFLIAFTLTLCIFLIGVIIGNYMISYKLDKYNTYEQDLKIDLMSSEIENSLIAETGCNITNKLPLTRSLYDLSEKLSYLENRFGWDDKNVLKMKEYYSLIELKHWMYINNLNKKCNYNYTTILYFYSNEGDCPRCKNQEFVLWHLKKKYKNIFIYSFDINMDNLALNTIKEIYGIKTITPSLIINKKTFVGFKNLNEIEEIIEQIIKDIV
ncbi:MAG: hypothetical protein B6U87_00730 [Candidatus Aenigmarchaeota archaeon ex4484_52]|nr:MAG: hypothetical protein B6U87_00730 [Candidatus Aenigmarchaeota archaeon ex4484_52]